MIVSKAHFSWAVSSTAAAKCVLTSSSWNAMNSNLTKSRVLILLLISPALCWILHPVMYLLQSEVPSGIIFITNSSLLPILCVACLEFTLGYWHQHCLRISGRACLVLLPSQQMSTWLKTSLSQRRLEFLLVVEIPSLLCLFQVAHDRLYHSIPHFPPVSDRMSAAPQWSTAQARSTLI